MTSLSLLAPEFNEQHLAAASLAWNTLTPLSRRIDERLPFPPLSLIAILEPRKNFQQQSQ